MKAATIFILMTCLVVGALSSPYRRNGHTGYSHGNRHRIQSNENLCHGMPEGTRFADVSSNCHKFITCIRHFPAFTSCPYGKRFDSTYGACIYSHKAVCREKPVFPPPKASSTPSTSTTTTTVTTEIPTLIG